MASFVLNCAVSVCAKLITDIAEARNNNPEKAFDLATLESTLKSIEPVIRDMERLNHEMGRSKNELQPLITKMEEGIKLLKKCWKSDSSYIAELHAFDESFRKLLDTIFKVQTARDQKERLKILILLNRFIKYCVLFFPFILLLLIILKFKGIHVFVIEFFSLTIFQSPSLLPTMFMYSAFTVLCLM